LTVRVGDAAVQSLKHKLDDETQRKKKSVN